jgi:rhamnosyltransferase
MKDMLGKGIKEKRMDARVLTREKICGCVILYHPTDKAFVNIQSYYRDVDRLYVVDNTERENFNHQLFRELSRWERIHYIPNFENYGIAHALNQAVEKAIEEGYDFILTMDQDSAVCKDYIGMLLRIVQKNNLDIATLGIIAPFHKVHEDFINVELQDISDKMVVMESGNLLNLNAYKKVGGFFEDLFIDRVDHEYCLRLRMHNYRVIQVNSVVLEHPLGHMAKHVLLNRAHYTSNHAPPRRYYMTRNTLYVIKKYGKIFPEYAKWERDILISDLKKIIIFETDKIDKLKMMLRGYCDHKKNVYGRLPPAKKASKFLGHSG